ncbi:F0F1 ATP synthase subunit delta [Mycoplasma sp. 613B]
MNTISSERINGYAQAIFQIALEQRKVDVFYKQTEKLSEIFKKEEDLLPYLKSFEIEFELKEELIDASFAKTYQAELVNMIKLLVQNHFISSINYIFNKFEKYALDYLKQKKGVVYSSHKLNKEYMDKIIDFIETKINKKVILKNEIDKKLIAGIKIIIDDLIFENSINSQLNQIKDHILKGKREK